MKKLFLLIIIIPFLVQGQLAVGTFRQAVTADTNGWVLTNPIGTSNQFSVVTSATTPNHVVRFGDFTNTVFIVTNKVASITFGGTGQSTTQLTGSWTNTVNFRVTGTNSANAYSVHGQLGFSGNVTNMVGTGLSNVVFYSDGIVTNRTTIP